MTSPALVVYPPSVRGRIGAVVRDVSLGLMSGAAATAGVSIVLLMVFDSMRGTSTLSGTRDFLGAMIGIGAGLVVLMIPFWTISSQAEMLGVVRSMHRGARETPLEVPVEFQRRMLDSLHYTRRRHMAGIIVTTVGIIAGAIICVALFMVATNDAEVVAAWIGVAVVLAIVISGIVAIRTGRENGPRNLGFIRASAVARDVWTPEAVAYARGGAAQRARRLTVVPMAAGAKTRRVAAGMMAVGFGIATLGTIIAWAAAGVGQLADETPSEGLVAGGFILLVGVAVLVLASVVKAVSEFRRFAALRRAIRDVDVRHERVAPEDLDTLIGDKPLARAWARRLAAFVPVSFLLAVLLEDVLPFAVVLAVPVRLFVVALIVAIVASAVGAGAARRACVAFGIGDREVVSLDETVMEDRSDVEHPYTPTAEALAARSGRPLADVQAELQAERRRRFGLPDEP